MHGASPIEDIRRLSKTFGGRVKAIRLFDVNLLHKPEVRGLSEDEREAYMLHHTFKFVKDGCTFRVTASDRYLVVGVEQELRVDLLSINAPDYVMSVRELLPNSTQRLDWPAYAKSGVLTDRLRILLSSERVLSLIRKLGLGDKDSLHFYRNALNVYRVYPPPMGVLETCEILRELAHEINDGSNLQASVTLVPLQFRELQPFVEHWAIGDDQLRDEMFESSNRDELIHFVEKTIPRLSDVYAYLDSHAGDEAATLSDLAETAREASQFLRLN